MPKNKKMGAKSGKEVKKGEMAKSAQYITRTRAIKKLQISLKDFRKLCILKGIFPRDPKLAKAKSGKDKTYYHLKDITFLAHEPLLAKFREFKSFLKKYTRAIGRRELDIAEGLVDRRPIYKLDHLVKERYPTFVDAIRDLDDPLCMIHLFCALPVKVIKEFSPERYAMCERLSREFQSFVFHNKALRKVFVSIKGIYYEADIHGQPVIWLVPHKFTQFLPDDVDYKVMMTFLEFYETLLRFVNFKLFSENNFVYPPKIDSINDSKRCSLDNLLKVESKSPTSSSSSSASSAAGKVTASVSVSKKRSRALQQEVAGVINKLGKKGEDALASSSASFSSSSSSSSHNESVEDLDDFSSLDPSLKGDDGIDSKAGTLFSGKTFFLGRETPVESLEFVILCGGGKTLRETELTTAELATSSSITHQVCDRPSVASPVIGREYVQPQWIYDSFNIRTLLPLQAYTPGVKLPPHLSPFVDDLKNGYIPDQRHVLRKWAGLKPLKLEEENGEYGDDNGMGMEGAEDGKEGKKGVAAKKKAKQQVDDEDEYQAGLKKERAGIHYSNADEDDDDEEDEEEDDDDDDDDDEGKDEEDEGDNDEEEDAEDEEDESFEDRDDDEEDEEEVVRQPVKTNVPSLAKKIKGPINDEDIGDEGGDLELAKSLMTKKNKRLLSRIEFGQQRKANENAKLMQKRKLAAQEEHQPAKRVARAPAGKKGK